MLKKHRKSGADRHFRHCREYTAPLKLKVLSPHHVKRVILDTSGKLKLRSFEWDPEHSGEMSNSEIFHLFKISIGFLRHFHRSQPILSIHPDVIWKDHSIFYLYGYITNLHNAWGERTFASITAYLGFIFVAITDDHLPSHLEKLHQYLLMWLCLIFINAFWGSICIIWQQHMLIFAVMTM